MKKLKLDLNDLKVDSFTTSNERKTQGTVLGFNTVTGQDQQCTCAPDHCWTGSQDPTCEGYLTCDETCAHTCQGDTCYARCTAPIECPL